MPVLEANLELPRRGWSPSRGATSRGGTRVRGLVVIKPSGVPYHDHDGGRHGGGRPGRQVVEGEFAGLPPIPRPIWSSTKVSLASVAWSTPIRRGPRPGHRLTRPSPIMGTTHADLSHWTNPCHCSAERRRGAEGIRGGYRPCRGGGGGGPPAGRVPAVLVSGHGTFCWGSSAAKAVEVAVTLEEVAKMAWLTVALAPSMRPSGGPHHRAPLFPQARPCGVLRPGMTANTALAREQRKRNR